MCRPRPSSLRWSPYLSCESALAPVSRRWAYHHWWIARLLRFRQCEKKNDDRSRWRQRFHSRPRPLKGIRSISRPIHPSMRLNEPHTPLNPQRLASVDRYLAGILRCGRKGSPRICNQQSEVFRCQTVGAVASRTPKISYSRHAGDGHENRDNARCRTFRRLPALHSSAGHSNRVRFPHYSQTTVSASPFKYAFSPPHFSLGVNDNYRQSV